MDGDDYDELQRLLAADDFENYDPVGDGDGEGGILNEEDLRTLTDRSEAAYEKAARGEVGSEKFRSIETKGGEVDLLGSLGK